MARHDYQAEAYVLKPHMEGDSFDGFELRSHGKLADMIRYVMNKPSTYRRHVGIFVPSTGDCLGPEEIERSADEQEELG